MSLWAGPNRTNVGSVYDSFIDADCVFSSARWGLIANNTIMNGGACHWFDQAQQVVFENNSCTGNNPMSMGNNVDSCKIVILSRIACCPSS